MSAGARFHSVSTCVAAAAAAFFRSRSHSVHCRPSTAWFMNYSKKAFVCDSVFYDIHAKIFKLFEIHWDNIHCNSIRFWFDSIRCDWIAFRSVRFDSIQFNSIPFDSISFQLNANECDEIRWTMVYFHVHFKWLFIIIYHFLMFQLIFNILTSFQWCHWKLKSTTTWTPHTENVFMCHDMENVTLLNARTTSLSNVFQLTKNCLNISIATCCLTHRPSTLECGKLVSLFESDGWKYFCCCRCNFHISFCVSFFVFEHFHFTSLNKYKWNNYKVNAHTKRCALFNQFAKGLTPFNTVCNTNKTTAC